MIKLPDGVTVRHGGQVYRGTVPDCLLPLVKHLIDPMDSAIKSKPQTKKDKDK